MRSQGRGSATAACARARAPAASGGVSRPADRACAATAASRSQGCGWAAARAKSASSASRTWLPPPAPSASDASSSGSTSRRTFRAQASGISGRHRHSQRHPSSRCAGLSTSAARAAAGRPSDSTGHFCRRARAVTNFSKIASPAAQSRPSPERPASSCGARAWAYLALSSGVECFAASAPPHVSCRGRAGRPSECNSVLRFAPHLLPPASCHAPSCGAMRMRNGALSRRGGRGSIGTAGTTRLRLALCTHHSPHHNEMPPAERTRLTGQTDWPPTVGLLSRPPASRGTL